MAGAAITLRSRLSRALIPYKPHNIGRPHGGRAAGPDAARTMSADRFASAARARPNERAIKQIVKNFKSTVDGASFVCRKLMGQTANAQGKVMRDVVKGLVKGSISPQDAITAIEQCKAAIGDNARVGIDRITQEIPAATTQIINAHGTARHLVQISDTAKKSIEKIVNNQSYLNKSFDRTIEWIRQKFGV